MHRFGPTRKPLCVTSEKSESQPPEEQRRAYSGRMSDACNIEKGTRTLEEYREYTGNELFYGEKLIERKPEESVH